MAERGEDDPEETDGIGESPGGKIFLYCFTKLRGEISVTSEMQMILPLWQKAKRN